MISKLHAQLKTMELPGETAHLKMTPYRHDAAKSFDYKNIKPRESAVLLLLFSKTEEIHCTLIQRPEYDGTHSRQVSFPGGKQEEDESLEQTALRETHEEVGVMPEQVSIIGKLSQLYIPPSNFMVNPFVGVLEKEPLFNIDNHEVEEVFTFPVLQLLDETIVKTTKIKLSNGLSLTSPYFDINNKVVWGATAAMLSEFKEILKKI